MNLFDERKGVKSKGMESGDWSGAGRCMVAGLDVGGQGVSSCEEEDCSLRPPAPEASAGKARYPFRVTAQRKKTRRFCARVFFFVDKRFEISNLDLVKGLMEVVESLVVLSLPSF
jgi:hypothetical protein